MRLAAPLTALLAVGTLTLTACSSAGSTDPGTGDEISIGVAIPAGNQTFWTAWMNGAQKRADELGVDVTFTDAKNDAQTMNDQINTLIVSGVQGIAMASVDPTANVPAVQAATDAGIPLISSNRLLDTGYGGVDGANPRVHTGFNDVLNGSNQGELLVQACAGLNPCTVVLEQGTLGSTPQIQRTQGLEDALKDHPEIQIIDRQSNDFDPTKAADLTQSLLQAHPDADVFAVQDDASALAVVKVFAEQGVGDASKIVSIGGSKDGVQAVADGTMFGTVKVSANDDGAASVQAIVDVIKGTDLETEDSDGVPTVVVPSMLITQENAAANPGDW